MSSQIWLTLFEPCRNTALARRFCSFCSSTSHLGYQQRRFFASKLPFSKSRLPTTSKRTDEVVIDDKNEEQMKNRNRRRPPLSKGDAHERRLHNALPQWKKKRLNSTDQEVPAKEEIPVKLPPDFEDKLKDWPALLMFEMQSEVDRINNLMDSGPLEELVASGSVIGYLKFQSENWYVGLKRLLRFRLPRDRSFPQTSLAPGGPVVLSDSEKHLVPLCEAILVSVKNKIVTLFVANDNYAKIEQALSEKNRTWVVAPSKSNTTIDRLISWSKAALKLDNQRGLGVGVDLLLYAYRAKIMHFTADDNQPHKFFYDLNEPQKKAVAAALNPKRPLVTIQGPPGTGKTLVVAEIIRQCVRDRKKVLVCAASNVAVDNILVRVKDDVPLVRLGIASNDEAQLFSIDDELNCGQHAAELQLKYKELEQIRFAYMLDDQERRDLLQKCTQEIKKIEQKAKMEVLEGKLVFFSTLSTSMLNLLSRYRINPHLVIIDEAAQAMEIASWLPIMLGFRCVLTGDPCQLPPVVLSEKAREGGLGVSLMQRLSTEFKPIKQLLTVQHRMHEDIMKWSSEYFYEGKLEAAPNVKHATLSQICNVEPMSVHDKPLLLIDTAGREDMREQKSSFAESTGNPGEARLVAIYLQKLIKLGLKQTDIGVITPYSLQAALIKELVSERYPDVMVNTVDSFQGQEKEAIILSLVRSNGHASSHRQVGFLADERRINVSVTRAKRHLVVIADSSTVVAAKAIASLLQVLRQDGIVQQAADYDKELKKLSLSMASIERVWKKAEKKTKQTDGSSAQRYATLYSDEPDTDKVQNETESSR